MKGAIVITCSCGSDKTSHVQTIEIDTVTFEHVFVCMDCEMTMVFRMIQILAARSDPDCLD